MRQGAYDYLEKPLKIDRLKELIPKAVEKFEVQQANRALEERLANMSPLRRPDRPVGGDARTSTPPSRPPRPPAPACSSSARAAPGRSWWRAPSTTSRRGKKGPFIAINCAAFPREILENELFGHEKGAFTGALNEKPGCFELADGGTLFLDEVAEMEPDIQVKFLRALEQRSFRRLGGKKEIQVDIRVVAATNKNINKAIDDGDLREDLYHRLAVIPLYLPPLRERRGDIRMLAEHFLRRFAEENGKEIEGFSPEALEFINEYRWPGNVRELKNAIERAVILAQRRADHPPRPARPRADHHRGPRDPHPGRHLAGAGRPDAHPQDLLLRQRRPPQGRLPPGDRRGGRCATQLTALLGGGAAAAT